MIESFGAEWSRVIVVLCQRFALVAVHRQETSSNDRDRVCYCWLVGAFNLSTCTLVLETRNLRDKYHLEQIVYTTDNYFMLQQNHRIYIIILGEDRIYYNFNVVLFCRHQCSSYKNGFSPIRSLSPRTKRLSLAEIVSLNTCMVQQQCKGESYYDKQYFTSSGHPFNPREQGCWNVSQLKLKQIINFQS